MNKESLFDELRSYHMETDYLKSIPKDKEFPLNWEHCDIAVVYGNSIINIYEHPDIPLGMLENYKDLIYEEFWEIRRNQKHYTYLKLRIKKYNFKIPFIFKNVFQVYNV